ncbi:hypothetical protein [Cohnella sp. JJ-181]|uniref:hypothetical protein n=1 Tax=Cohnella rhizoplanae TaxID=2974897 RepID=UPI0022FFBD1E|nr:hypothetical protein [Cohnella sp. JJ-181]CAI6082805.1 hypothetical protein COHCIP112018_03768 [Cohnella sp. JJ-181]
MNRLKKHAAIPIAATAVCIILAFAFSTYGSKEKARFELKDLAGSREALRDVEIGGELTDGYYRTAFRIAEGILGTKTKIFEQPKDPNRYPFGGANQTGDEITYSFDNRSVSYHILAWQWKDNDPIAVRETELNPPIAYHGPEADANAVRMANSAEYGLAKIGDRVYYTPPVSSYFTGTSGIYELKFYEWGLGPFVDKQDYAPRKVADIPLGANKAGGNGIEVLGMKAVGDRLALLTVQNHALVVQGYDSVSGRVLGEVSVPDFYPVGRPSDPAAASAHYEPYESYADESGDRLIVSFRRSAAGEEARAPTTVLVLDFAGGVKLVQRFELSLDEGESRTLGYVSDMQYLNGKLYVVKSWQGQAAGPESDPARAIRRVRNQNRLYLYVFEPSQLIYKGELITDMNEDRIHTLNAREGQPGYGYSETDMRTFANVSIEPDNPSGTGGK